MSLLVPPPASCQSGSWASGSQQAARKPTCRSREATRRAGRC